jgi:hypothetical protein
MGQCLSGVFIPLAYQPYFVGRCKWQDSPSTSTPTWQGLVGKQSKANQGGGISKNSQAAFYELYNRYFFPEAPPVM